MAEPAYPLGFLEDGDGQPWPAQGEWTYKDYLRLPDDGRRYEVLRGDLYVTPAPAYDHQFSVSRLTYHLTHFSLERDLGIVLGTPFDIRLPRGIGAPVQPDLIFFRKGNEPQTGDKNFQGVPDLVIEVLSPGTRRVDERTKMSIYREAGIPEYWLVDPQARSIVIYRLSEDRQGYFEWQRGGEGDTVGSVVLSGLRLAVSDVFPR